MRLILYTGKGGVGKTTTAAATGALAAQRGLRTLVVSADAAHSLGDVFDRRLGEAQRTVHEDVAASVSRFTVTDIKRHIGCRMQYAECRGSAYSAWSAEPPYTEFWYL